MYMYVNGINHLAILSLVTVFFLSVTHISKDEVCARKGAVASGDPYVTPQCVCDILDIHQCMGSPLADSVHPISPWLP